MKIRIFLCSSLLLLTGVQSFGPTFQKTFARPSKFFALKGTFDSLTVAELKDELRSRGLKVTGKKNELIERLESHEMTTTSWKDDNVAPQVPEEQVESLVPSETQANRAASLSDSMTFSDLGIVPQLLTSIKFQGWEEPTPIQKLAVPEILKAFQEGPDADDITSIWAEAPTGSGKTGAFAIPLIQLTMENTQKKVESTK
jgi:Superfamily II DNA and RNA helicases